jgi:hypothetical protein
MQPIAHQPDESGVSVRSRRYTILNLLILIAATAFALAAISRPSWAMANAACSILICSLNVAFIGVLYRTGRTRAFWTGLLACGSCYAALSISPWFATSIGSRLITTTIIDCVYPYLPNSLARSLSDPNQPWQQWAATPPGAGSMYDRLGMYMKTSPAFLLIGHSLFAALAAVGGGFLAVRFYATRR